MADQPQSCADAGCPLFGVARGFCLGSGDPARAKYAAILEAPGKDEISFSLTPAARAFFPTQEECDRELAIRRRDYPELEEKHIRFGAPVVGATGLALNFWIWQKVGIRREETFVDNTIRCLVPKGKNGSPYPTGDTRKAAEKACRQYDRLDKFKPDTVVISIHPAALLRSIVPLPLLVKDAEKVRDFTAQGRRVIALIGGKAAHAFLRYASSVQKWRGHYQALSEDWIHTYRSLFDYKAKVKREKKPKDACPGCGSEKKKTKLNDCQNEWHKPKRKKKEPECLASTI